MRVVTPFEIPCNAQQNRFKDAASLSHTAEAPLMTPTRLTIHRYWCKVQDHFTEQPYDCVIPEENDSNVPITSPNRALGVFSLSPVVTVHSPSLIGCLLSAPDLILTFLASCTGRWSTAPPPRTGAQR